MFMRIRSITAGLALALAATAFHGHGAQAQTDQQWEWCEGSPDASEQQQVNACTQILNSGHLAVPERAWALYNRAHSYIDLRQYRQAIRDLDEAIRYDSEHAEYWWERHIAKESLGDESGAQFDFNRAKQLNPNIDREGASYLPPKQPRKL